MSDTGPRGLLGRGAGSRLRPELALLPAFRQGLVVVGAVTTLSLGVLYELDSRALEARGSGVPLAGSYALVAPVSVVALGLLGPGLARIPLLGLLVGPPTSALLYVWQWGRHASVRR